MSSQFFLLMWKNFKVQIKSPIWTLVEILLPIWVVILVAFLRGLVGFFYYLLLIKIINSIYFYFLNVFFIQTENKVITPALAASPLPIFGSTADGLCPDVSGLDVPYCTGVCAFQPILNG